jgi:transposase-like protein
MTDELTPEERQAWARWMYLNEDISIRDLALTVNTDETTIRKWVQQGAWYGSKRSLLTSKKAQLEFLYTALETVNNKIKDSDPVNLKDIDQALKYINAIHNLEVEMPVTQIIEVFEGFILWLQRRDLRLAQKIVVYLDAFIKEREED